MSRLAPPVTDAVSERTLSLEIVRAVREAVTTHGALRGAGLAICLDLDGLDPAVTPGVGEQRSDMPSEENAALQKSAGAVRELVDASPKPGLNNFAVTHKTNVADAFGRAANLAHDLATLAQRTESGEVLDYDHLVLALGAEPAYFGIPGAKLVPWANPSRMFQPCWR